MKRLMLVLLAAGLIVSFVFPLYNFAEEEDEVIEFIGANVCKMCHNQKSKGKYYDDWMGSAHAKAFDRLSEEEQKNPKCQKCHTTGFGAPGGFVSLEDKQSKKKLHVQCEMCHGPGGNHKRSNPKKKIPNAWKPEEKRCGVCHNPESPFWDPERYVDEEGNKAGFIYKIAVKKVNHSKVKEALKQQNP